MTRTQAWTCAMCNVTASYASDTATPDHPDGWERSNGTWLCLRCRREAAMDEAGSGNDAEGRALRRRALVEFEVRRDPSAPDGIVARRARCSTAAVRPVRQELERSGQL